MDVLTVPRLVDLAAAWRAGAARDLAPTPDRPGGLTVVAVDLTGHAGDPAPPHLADGLAAVPAVVVGIAGETHPPQPQGIAEVVDVVVGNVGAAGEVVEAVEAHPVAAMALVLLLRTGAWRTIETGLLAESATYSALQAGPEFARWLSAHTRRSRPPEREPAVRLERSAGRLTLTLNRPHVRNAFDARTRDELLDGLAVAAADDAVAEIVLRGEGPSFCSGGDLDEFGTFADPASAHALRLTRSAGRAVAALADRVVAHVHGTCVGAGVELPAFAGRVVTAPDATFRLPEVAMGLVPGAGGTVSLPRRIGRQRTAWLALTGRPIDAPTALAWGLVDEIRPPRSSVGTAERHPKL